MFKVTTGKRTFTHDVLVLSPADTGFAEDKLKTTFVALDKDAVDKFDIRTVEGTDALLAAAVESFHDLSDDAGHPIPYSAEIRAILLARQNVRQAVLLHYFDAVSKAKLGN